MADHGGGILPKKTADWRGKSGNTKALSKPAWQDERRSQESRRTRRRNALRRVLVGCFLIFSVAGAFGLLYAILYRDIRVPFVAVVQTAYPPSFPPNAWSYEDLESLRTGSEALDRKTIDVIDFSTNQRSGETLLLISPDDRQRAIKQAVRAGVIIFSISMHGVVNDKGEACLATSDAAPLDSATWLPVSRVLSQIHDWHLPDHVFKLLILDCNRQASDLSIGLFQNTFALRLRRAFDEHQIPNLAILNSASPGQMGLATPEMHGTVFGQYVRLGLAGAADLPREGGNNDRRVSFKELQSYVERHVDTWARDNRGIRQQPMTIAKDLTDTPLTCSLDHRHLNTLLTRFTSGSATEPSVSLKQIDELWSAIETLRDQKADSFAPLEMGKMRRQLTWLEQASRAGVAYRLESIATESELRRATSTLRERLMHTVSSEIAVQSHVVDAEYNDVCVSGLASRLRSIPLLARLGRVEPATIATLLETLGQLDGQTTFEKLSTNLVDPTSDSKLKSLDIVHFLGLLGNSQRLRGAPAIPADLLTSTRELHSLAADVCVPGDPRVQSWIRNAVRAADANRRAADDALLIGVPDWEQFKRSQLGYREALAIAKTVEQAYELTDVVTAELPDLSRWLDSMNVRDDWSPARFEKFISTLHLLANNLDSPKGTDGDLSATDLSFLPQFDSLAAEYKSLREFLNAEYERLSSTTTFTPETVHHATAILSLPLLPTRKAESGLTPLEQRQKIREWHLQASVELHRQSIKRLGGQGVAGPSKSEGPPSPDAEVPDGNSSRPTKTALPLAGLLDAFGSPATDVVQNPVALGSAETAEAAGSSMRKALRLMSQEIAGARERHMKSADHPRSEWSRAARMARCSAPFITSTWRTDPVAELRRVDLQQILLGQAQRYLDDFWGPVASGQPSFFESATSDSVEAARMVCMANPATEKEIRRLKGLLAARKNAAREGLTVHADSLLLVDVVERPEARVSISKSRAGRDVNLPTGSAMLRLADRDQNLLGPVVSFLIDPSGAARDSMPQELHIPLGDEHREFADAVGTATAVFRGHEFRDDLVIKTAAGATIETRSQHLRSARIRLSGEKRQRISVVFVLDCSASMQKGMPFESAGSIVPRMDIAKAALVRMLNTLAVRGDARVGVLLYGHRVGWNTKEPNQLMSQSAWGDPIPEDLKPFEDVETILPLGRFDALASAKVAQRLEKVKPWGETPLYLSMIQALTEFKENDSDAQRSVVVITDGLNYQFNPSQEAAKTLQDVLVADGARRVPLHIVGFGILADEAQGAQREFSRLARETGGQYVSVSEATALTRTLEGILQNQQYTVASSTGIVARAPLGTPIDVRWTGDASQEYAVGLEAVSSRVELTGGEAVELFLSQDGSSMISATYDVGSPFFVNLLGGAESDSAGVRLGIHLPHRDQTSVTFDLSLQHSQQQFVRRPRELWIEVTPILSDKRSAKNLKYVFYEPEFVPNSPVPVLRAYARGWPQDASRARIEFWCKWSETEPSLLIPFSKLPDSGQPATPGAAIDGIPGLKYQIRRNAGPPLRIDFVETYAQDQPGATQLKVDIIGAVPPSRALHQFDEANRLATHTFLFDEPHENLLNVSNSLRVVSRRRMLSDACYLEVPILLEVPSQSELLPLSP